MRLLSLRLLNFRQHADTRIEFRPGLTGIIGPNGAGKSTILEGLAWAIYGSAAARGTNDTIRFSRAGSRSRVEVELAFELAGHEYRVLRSLSSAEVLVDGRANAAASGLAGVTSFLEARLGMSRDEFFNTYFTGQKQLQFLAQLGPTQRARFLSRLLGYERLRVAQDRARSRRTEIRHELEGLRAGMTDPEELEQRRVEADTRLRDAESAKKDASAAKRSATRKLRRAEPRWVAIQEKREQDRELERARDAAVAEQQVADRDAERAAKAVAEIEEASSERAQLDGDLASLPATADAVARFDVLARAAERRRALEESKQAHEAELRDLAARLETLGQAPELVERYRDELESARSAADRAEEAMQEVRSEWSGKRREIGTRLEAYRKRARELKKQIAELREAGPDGVCPTCERPLGGEFDNVVARLEDELLTQVQDGKWLAQRETQLESEPEELVAATSVRDSTRKTADECAQRLARCEQAVQEIWTLAGERKRKAERLEQLTKELDELPSGYDAAEHERLTSRLRDLHTIETRAAGLDRAISRRAEVERELEEARTGSADAAKRIGEIAAERASVAFDADAFDSEKAAYEEALAASNRAEISAVEAAGKVDAAREGLESVEREIQTQQKRRDRVSSLESELRHHNELDAALTRLRGDLNSRVRPELSELASTFLAQITDGRYSALEIDEAYNVVVLDEGEPKPVISGGEEDIANLVLRLAISQMIAERAGQQLSILVLDEVFGSLDIERRDNVIDLLHKLEARFEQVILITHIDTVREGIDHVLRVEFDERSGASRVVEESIADTPMRPQLVP